VRLALFCMVGVFCASGCGRAPEAEPRHVPIPAFDGAAAFRECADFVKLGPKPAGTPGAEAAAVYLERRLTAMGIEARIDTFEDAVPPGTGTFRNVLGRIPGDTNRIIVIAAHYDTKTGISVDFAGANDSGSGVGVVLEAMKAMAGVRRDGGAEIRAAFFDGEECRREYGPMDGLHGSRHLARQWVESGEARRVKAFILLDMVGDRDLTVTVPPNGTPALLEAVFGAARAEGVRDRFFLSPGGILDDHQPFLNAGIPSVDLIDFRYGSSPGGNEYWHTPADTMDKLDAASLDAVGRVVLRVMAGLE
jgi:glutaminyl-peptide cyclotransferase